MNKSIVTKIIVIFIFIGILPMILFNYVYIVDSEKANKEIMKESLQKLVEEKSQVLNLTFKQIENQAENIGQWMNYYKKNNTSDEEIMKYLLSINVDFNKIERKVLESEKFIKYIEKNNITNVYIPNEKNINFEIVSDVLNTRFVEKYLADASKNLSGVGIAWSYIITKNDLLRIYPYTSMETFEENHSFKEDIYYEIANEINNPEKSTIWTVPYVDWCGIGWVITCSYPIYDDNGFYGIVSIDVPLEKINSTIYDFKIHDSGFAFLVDNKGNVIHHPEALNRNKEKGEPLSINLLSNSKDKEFHSIIEKMMMGEKGLELYTDKITGRKKAIVYSNIGNPEWSVGIEVDWDNYLESNYGYSKYLIMVMIPIIFLISISGIYIFRKISMPISVLAASVKSMENGNFNQSIPVDRHDEIGILADSFNKMSESINKYTDDLIKKNNEIQAIFNSFPGILYIIDKSYNIKILNYKGFKVLGYDYENINIDKQLKCYEEFFNRDFPCINCPKNKYNSLLETNFSDIVHKKRLFRISAHPIYEKDSKISEWVMYNTEITEQFFLENSIAQDKKMSRIGQIVSGVTHELRNPIGVIKGSNYLIKDILSNYNNNDREIEEIRELLDIIEERVRYSESTISNLLDFSKISVNKNDSINIIKILDQILILEQNNIIKGNIKVIKNYKEKEVFASGNADSYKHIFFNIISNAIQAMPKENAILELNFSRTNNGIEFSIRDNGIGIEDIIKESIFDPFITTKADDGYGLGLWIVKNELEKIGGKIDVESGIEIGSNFIIYLPIGDDKN